ncbi:hypothetical protein D9C73_011749 [Collichthys lucidus]|uniref:Uncharacterized protein n=1 Tax=Collichthys lucidus TaxID=240159 RepID=A0A4U5USJ2_COLLU|nr:hypothetical protein D9C73_011749 [Collichthys lucidus]
MTAEFLKLRELQLAVSTKPTEQYVSIWESVCRVALGMSTHSCIIQRLAGAAADAVTHARNTVSAPAESLTTDAPRPMAAWKART